MISVGNVSSEQVYIKYRNTCLLQKQITLFKRTTLFLLLLLLNISKIGKWITMWLFKLIICQTAVYKWHDVLFVSCFHKARITWWNWGLCSLFTLWYLTLELYEFGLVPQINILLKHTREKSKNILQLLVKVRFLSAGVYTHTHTLTNTDKYLQIWSINNKRCW